VWAKDCHAIPPAWRTHDNTCPRPCQKANGVPPRKMVSSGLETRNGPIWSFIDRKIVRYKKDGLSRTRHQIREYAQLSIPPK
jgi:hypothetical protein